MREGSNYIGGCCGTSGYTQDVLNEIFREGGWVDSRLAHELVQVGASHEGHEILTERKEEKVLAEVRNWKRLYPFQKIMLCVRAALPQMRMTRDIPYRTASEEPDDVIAALYGAISHLRYKDLFTDKNAMGDVKSGQKHGNTALRVARAVPAAQAFLVVAEQVAEGPFEGFAIVDDKNEVTTNGLGMTVYYTRAEARSMLSTWKKGDRAIKNPQMRSKILDKLKIRPGRITIERGLELL
jgi:hypothetical protein